LSLAVDFQACLDSLREIDRIEVYNQKGQLTASCEKEWLRMKLVECVPNFSEGRDRQKIEAIVREIENTPEVKLLDVDPGEATNRTVVTFIGSPEGVKQAAFKAIKKAAELIDMRQHRGAHPRLGATDVCPFVPVSEVSMEDCVQLANELPPGRRRVAYSGLLI